MIPTTDETVYDDEAPQHDVFVDGYEISRYPITNEQYQAFIKDGGYTERWESCWTPAGWAWRAGEGRTGPEFYGGNFDWANHPVVGVTWCKGGRLLWLADAERGATGDAAD